MRKPQESNLVDTSVLSDVGARVGGSVGDIVHVVSSGGGVGTGVPSTFVGGFPSAPAAPSSSSSTVFGGGSEARKMLCSDQYARLSEDEQDRILTSLPKSAQHQLVQESNNLRLGMLSETRVSRKRAKAVEHENQNLRLTLEMAKQEALSFLQDKKELESI